MLAFVIQKTRIMKRPLLLFHCLLAAAFATAAETRRPNIVFILADDLGYGETGCYGQKKIRTPNIDQLAAGGIRFTQAYTGTPVCAPARCNLMTGKHGGHSEIRGNLQAKVHFPEFKEGQYPLSKDAVTLATVLKRAGYATGAFGKWGLGPVGSTGDPLKQGFDRFFGYNCQAVAHSYYPKYLWDNDKQILINEKPIPGSRKQPEGEVRMADYIGQQYASHLIRREALAFIDRHKDQPFFLYLPFIEPHVAMHPPEDLVNEYPKEWDNEAYRGESAYLPHPRPRAGYAAMITDLDRHVGAVMEALKKHGLEDNTLVIFTSDNGTTHPLKPNSHFNVGGVDAEFFNSLAGLKGFKGSLYEGGIRIPYIARFPGRIAAGTTSDFPTYFPDQFPTLCEVAGIPAPTGLDGISILPVLRGEPTKVKRNPMVWVYPEYGGQVAVRIGDFKVMRTGINSKNPGEWEVYDVANDRNETTDLAAKQPELIKKAKSILDHQWDDSNPRYPMSKTSALE
jgi:arylsulfatase A-like enzyme